MPDFGTHHHPDIISQVSFDIDEVILVIAEKIFYNIMLDVLHSKLLAKKFMNLFNVDSLDMIIHDEHSVFQKVEIVYIGNIVKFRCCFPLSSINIHRILNINYIYDFDLEKIFNRPYHIKNKKNTAENIFSRLYHDGVVGFRVK